MVASSGSSDGAPCSSARRAGCGPRIVGYAANAVVNAGRISEMTGSTVPFLRPRIELTEALFPTGHRFRVAATTSGEAPT